MSRNRGRHLLIALVVVVGVDAAWVWSSRRHDAGAERPFQRATCGVGLGAAVSPAWSFFAIDPRAETYCENELWPIPGITCYSPRHGATVADLPPLDRFIYRGKHQHDPKGDGP